MKFSNKAKDKLNKIREDDEKKLEEEQTYSAMLFHNICPKCGGKLLFKDGFFTVRYNCTKCDFELKEVVKPKGC